MGSFSDHLETELLDHAFSNATYAPVATLFAALYTAAPSDAGGGTEVSTTGYARATISFGAASGDSVTNDAAVTFPTAGADWGTVTHFAVHDLITSGNMLAWATLTTAKAINSGDVAKFATGTLQITLD